MSRIARCLAALSVLVLVCWPTAASAHTGFEKSDPADGAVVDQPVEIITLTFTGPAEPTGEGFVALDPADGPRQPTAINRVADGVFGLRFDPPLTGGDVGVRWSVRAPDAHPISGSFRFTVDAPAPASGRGSAEQGATVRPAGADLDAFLGTDGTWAAGKWSADLGRFLSMGATVVAVGFLVFSLTVMRGTRGELRMLLFWVRRAGLVIVVGTLADATGQLAHQGGGLGAVFDPGAWASTLAGGAGLALLARIGGGAIIASRADLVMVHARHARDVLRPISAAVPVGAGSVRVADRDPHEWHSQDLAWELDRRGRIAMAGFLAVLVSHVFDGHTVTEGNRWITGVSSSAHVFAAAVWAGGVLALAMVIHRRWRRDEPTHALVMVTRYSIVATFALALVALSGVYLAFVILDAPSELWGTEWGRYFSAKFALVAVAAAFGAHNHHVIVPALEASEERPDAVRTLRSTLNKEVVALTTVTLLTALLVRSASTM